MPHSASRSIFAPVTYWDSLRWVNRPSFWDRSVTTYGPLTVVPLAEWPQRAADWATQLGYLFGLPVLSGLTLLIAPPWGASHPDSVRARGGFGRRNVLPSAVPRRQR